MGWIGDEPAGRESVGELLRLLRRAGRCPLLTLAMALLAAALVFAVQLRRPPVFVARAELLVRENALSTDRALLSRDDLRSFVENVVLTSSRLIEVMDRHGLFRAAAARSRVLALAEMRESIGVEILQDYFAEDRLEHGPKRTARIVITFQSHEPEEAMVVVQELGLLVTQAELGRHAERARGQADFAGAAAAEARKQAVRTQAELAVMESASPSASQKVKVAFLRSWLAKLEARRSQLDREYEQLELAAAAEEKQAGTRVHLASLQAETGGPRNSGHWVRRKAAIAGAAGLVLAVLLVGAFDPRLYDADAIRRAGSLCLGSLHALDKRRPTSRGDAT